MDNTFLCDRLFNQLKVSGGKRQFVLSGEIEDYYMLSWKSGLGNLETVLREYLKSRGFEIILFIRSLNHPEFLTPEMERHFQEITRGTSVDPQNTGQKSHTFVPRGARRENTSPTPDSTSATGSDSVNSTARQATPESSSDSVRQAEQTAIEVTNAGNNSEQSFLDLLTRLFKSGTKCVVVFFYPENMWMAQPTENDLHKLETILRWSTITSGHPESASILVVNPCRLNEFNLLADHRLDRSNFTKTIQVSLPGKREIEAFLMRFACRYGFSGQLNKIAATAYSKKLPLFNFSEQIREYVKNNLDNRNLDGVFSDSSQAKTLDELLAEINGLVGLASLKAELHKIVANAQYSREQRRLGREFSPPGYHMFFLGNPGTGKTMVARLLGQIFWALELRPTQAFVEIAYSDIISSNNEGETVENMKNKIREANGGVLFVDEFYLFAENQWGRKAFETLMKEMEDHRDNLTVIMAGYEDKLPELFKINPGFKSRINRILTFPDYSVGEMIQIFEKMAQKEGNLVLNEMSKAKLHRYLDSFSKRGGIGNGRGVRNLFEKTKENRGLRHAEDSTILPEDLPDPIMFREEEARAIITDLEKNFIGLSRVKKFFSDIYRQQRGIELQGETVTGINNCVFVGNPGTGKTSVAKKMGNLFYSLGLISEKNKLIEVDPIADLTSQYQGEYAQKVRDVFDRALGGVLFIDEAYQLAKDDQGRKVLDQLVKKTTEPAYSNLVVIMAGYPDDMRELDNINPGLKDRFPHKVYFDDFTPDELSQIFYQRMKRDKKSVALSERELFHTRLKTLLARMAASRNFGNARAVNTFYINTVKSNQTTRLLNHPDADKSIFTVEDLTGQKENNRESINDILTELEDKFIGMRSLKDRIRGLSTRFYAEKKRAEALKSATPSITPGRYNMRFVGNPGTGKTSIARYMARVFCSLGIIEHPQVKEYRGVDLKASYLGQTKDRVNKIFESGEGCVIIIDEVYSLYDPHAGNADSYGQEAIDTLVGCITDPRNATTIVVIAGYKDKMDAFLNANQGLASRFGTEIDFPDYSAEDCAQILKRKIRAESMMYPENNDFQLLLVELFNTIRTQSGKNFGNARTVESVFEQMKENQGRRLVPLGDNATPQDWMSILPGDVPKYFDD